MHRSTALIAKLIDKRTIVRHYSTGSLYQTQPGRQQSLYNIIISAYYLHMAVDAYDCPCCTDSDSLLTVFLTDFSELI